MEKPFGDAGCRDSGLRPLLGRGFCPRQAPPVGAPERLHCRGLQAGLQGGDRACLSLTVGQIAPDAGRIRADSELVSRLPKQSGLVFTHFVKRKASCRQHWKDRSGPDTPTGRTSVRERPAASSAGRGGSRPRGGREPRPSAVSTPDPGLSFLPHRDGGSAIEVGRAWDGVEVGACLPRARWWAPCPQAGR